MRAFEDQHRRELNARLWQAWHIANWQRAKKLPSWKSVELKAPRKRLSDEQATAFLVAEAKRLGGTVVYREKGAALDG